MKTRWIPLLLLLTATITHAQTYPAKSIRMVVPVPPGGIIDVVGRLLGAKITEHTGQTVIIDNRTGGLTGVGSEMVARSPGDGYTLLLQSLPMVINPSMLGKMSYDYEKDLAPISLVVTSPYLLVVHPSVPAKTIQQLVALAKAQPGKINYSSSGIGGAPHLAAELLSHMSGARFIKTQQLRSALGDVDDAFAVVRSAIVDPQLD